MRRRNRKNFKNYLDTRINTTDDDIKFNLGDRITAQKYDVEISKEIVEERKAIDVPRKKVLDIDKIRSQKGDVEISNEIVEDIKRVDGFKLY